VVSLARTASGLLYQSDGSLSGWTNGGDWSSVAANRFPASPITPINAGCQKIQMKGEPKLQIVGNNWYLCYNDVVSLNGGALTSLPAVQRSADRGITWCDLGLMTWISRTNNGIALGEVYLDPVSGNWFLGAVTSPTLTPAGGLLGPFAFSVFSGTSNILGPYSLAQNITAFAGTWANVNPGPGGVFWDGTHYNMFGSGGNVTSQSCCGIFQFTAFNSTFTQPSPSAPIYNFSLDGPNLTAVGMISVEGEAFAYNPTLNLYMLTFTSAANDGNDYDYSLMIQSSATLTGFDTSSWKHVQWVCPADTIKITSSSKIIHNGSNSTALTGPNGEMALITATQYPGVTDIPGHYVGLIASYAILEPASAVIRYTGAADTTYRQLVRSLAHTDITVECACELTGVNAGGGEFHIVYRSDGTGNNEYRAVLAANTQWRLDKYVGGTRSLLATGTGTQAYGNQGATLGMLHRLKVQVVGNVHRAWLDGELQYTFTDSSSPFTSGTSLSLAGIGSNCDVINLSARTSDTLTVTGMQPGTSVWLRAACGIPIAPVTANGSGVGTISYGHFPLYSLDIAGTDYTVGTDSRIWGGDTLAFSGLPASAPSPPALSHYL
jgi:hypothetical protein